MSGKPAARQGDMTQVGGPIVQGSAGGNDWRPDGSGMFSMPDRKGFAEVR